MKTAHFQDIERDGETITVEVVIKWTYDEGQYVEQGHPCNGEGAGWYADHVEAFGVCGQPYELTDSEYEYAQERAQSQF